MESIPIVFPDCAKCQALYERRTKEYAKFLENFERVKQCIKDFTVEGFDVDTYVKKPLDRFDGLSVLNMVNEGRADEVIEAFDNIFEGYI